MHITSKKSIIRHKKWEVEHMDYAILQIGIHLLCFALSFYALSGIQFDKLCNVRKPLKVQLLILLAAMAMGYGAAQFILALTVFNGL